MRCRDPIWSPYSAHQPRSDASSAILMSSCQRSPSTPRAVRIFITSVTGERPPNVTDVMKILTALGVDGDRWHELIKIAEEASERGWWAEYGDHMGSRQRIYADLEAGA